MAWNSATAPDDAAAAHKAFSRSLETRVGRPSITGTFSLEAEPKR